MTYVKKLSIPENGNFYHHAAHTLSDRCAYAFVKTAVVFANLFFRKRYGHRAIVLETIAAIPGMVGGLFQHMKSLRHMKDDKGWIQALLSEAENERMHLMVYIHVARPTMLERAIIVLAQWVFYTFYFLIYTFSGRTAHRLVGYLEEEAVRSYTHYLEQIIAGEHPDILAPQIAIDYWGLDPSARLRDVVEATRRDEMLHRDTNHTLADRIDQAHRT